MAGITVLAAFTVYFATSLILRPLERKSPTPMTTRRKILFGVFGFYLFSLAAVIVIFGFTRQDNEEFVPQNEFKLDTWIDLPGPLDFNKAVMYLIIAGILTVGTMIWIAGRMQARPNRVQTAVEALFSLMRDNITYGNLDDTDGRAVVPVHRDAVPLHLVQQPDRLHPAADQHRAPRSSCSASRSRPSRSTPRPRTCRSRSRWR